MNLNFTVNGKSYIHNERKWQVCTNRHPNTDGSPWGWIEGIAKNTTWSGSDGRRHAQDVVDSHNAWVDAQEPPTIKVARLIPELERLGREREQLLSRVRLLLEQEDAIAAQIRECKAARAQEADRG